MHLKNLLIFTITLLLLGCTTIAQKQTECESAYQKFSEIVACTKAAFADSKRAQSDASARLYFMTADELVEQVNRGTITESQAKLEWQRLYVNLKNKAEANAARDMQLYNQMKPTQTVCTPIGNTVRCNSY